MQLSEKTGKWIMRFYPPLFFQRIWVKRIHKNFRGIDVKVNKSLLNINLNRSIFGGTLFSSTDPFYPFLLVQILKNQGYKNIITWIKSAEIDFKKPATKNLTFTIQISDSVIEEIKNTLENEGKYINKFEIELKNEEGEVCAVSIPEVYIKNLDFNIVY